MEKYGNGSCRFAENIMYRPVSLYSFTWYSNKNTLWFKKTPANKNVHRPMSYVCFFPKSQGRKTDPGCEYLHWFNSLGFQVIMVVTPKVFEKMDGPQKETIQSSNRPLIFGDQYSNYLQDPWDHGIFAYHLPWKINEQNVGNCRVEVYQLEKLGRCFQIFSEVSPRTLGKINPILTHSFSTNQLLNTREKQPALEVFQVHQLALGKFCRKRSVGRHLSKYM